MKHLKKGRKFGREIGQRRAMLKILLGEILLRGKMTTSVAKAKEIQSIVDKLIGNAKLALAKEKEGRLSSMRLILGSLPRNITLKKLEEIAGSFTDRKSGFSRIMKIGQRKSDGAHMAILELIKDEKKEEKPKTK